MGRRATGTTLAALGVVLEATVCYRAVTQSITYDEAAAYLKFLRGPLTDVFTHYDASNHVLFAALARVSSAVFGVSAFSLRLPSLIGAAGFFVAIAAICRRLFGAGVLAVLAVAMVALNPFVLDLMSAARGYGLAFSLLTIGLYSLTLGLDDDPARLAVRWGAASVALGLAAAAQLTFVFPAVALAVAAAGERLTRAAPRRLMHELVWLLVPGAVVASTILGVPLRNARPGTFYYGADAIGRSFWSVIRPVFDHGAPVWACAASNQDRRVSAAAAAVCAVLTVLIVVGLFAAWRQDPEDRGLSPLLARFTVVASTSVLLTLLQLFVTHAAFGFPYPEGRTGLYLWLLFPMAASSAVAVLWNRRPAGILGRAGVVLLAVIPAWFVSEFTVTYFYEWRFDAGTRRIMDIVAERAQRTGRPLRVWADDLEPSFSFYQIVERPAGIAPVPEARTVPSPAYDLLLACSKRERELAATIGTQIYVDPVSEAVLVEKR